MTTESPEITSTDLIDENAAAARLTLRPQTLANWRSTGRYGLPYVLMGRLVRYRVGDIERFIASRLVGADPTEINAHTHGHPGLDGHIAARRGHGGAIRAINP